jgi:competence protein ComEA
MTNRAMAVCVALVLFVSPLAAQRATKPAPAGKGAPAAPAVQLINLNTATATEIATLPGIGPKTAELVVEYREKNGSFKKIEDLMNVRGIGEKTFLKLKDRLTVSGK